MLAVWGALIGQTVGDTTHYLQLTQFHYFAFILIGSLLISFFFFRKYYKYVVVVALFAGVFDLACFSGADAIIMIGGKKSKLTLQPLSLVVAFAFFIINYNRISEWFKEKNEPRPEVIPGNEKNAFIEKYEHLSDEELYTIRGDKRYVPAARVAAEYIISERIEKRKMSTD
jgi:hypothetical protein